MSYYDDPDYEPEPMTWRQFIRAAGSYIREDAKAAGVKVRFHRLTIVREKGCKCGAFSYPWHIEVDPPISLRQLDDAAHIGHATRPPNYDRKRRFFDASIDEDGCIYYACSEGRDHTHYIDEPRAPEDHFSECPIYPGDHCPCDV